MSKVFNNELKKMGDKALRLKHIPVNRVARLARRYYEYSWVLERIKKRKGKKILDVGCGGSPLPLLFAVDGARVIALDIKWPSQDVAEIAFYILFSLYPRYNFSYINCDADNTPFKDNYFDYITCTSVFQTVSIVKWNKIIKELSRILKGILLITADYEYTANKLPTNYEGLKLQEHSQKGSLRMLALKKQKNL